MPQFVIDNIAICWLILGAALVIAEVTVATGVGFLFIGLGAIIVGGLVAFSVMVPDAYLSQIGVFFITSSVVAAALWRPLKLFVNRQHARGYSHVVGQVAVVIDAPLKAAVLGKVRWSGTVMDARLSGDAAVSAIEIGKEVIITGMSGSELIVKPKS